MASTPNAAQQPPNQHQEERAESQQGRGSEPPIWPVQIELTQPLSGDGIPSQFDPEQDTPTVPMPQNPLATGRTTLVLAGMNSNGRADPQPALNHPIQPPIFNLSTASYAPGTTYNDLAAQGELTAHLLLSPGVSAGDLANDAEAFDSLLNERAQLAVPGSAMPIQRLSPDQRRTVKALYDQWLAQQGASGHNNSAQNGSANAQGADPRMMGGI